MRVYFQIPIAGTEHASSTVRASQAAPPRPHKELRALKDLKRLNRDVVPDLLAYKQGVQDRDAIVPGGYVTYIVWGMVPGKSLDHEVFWDLNFASQEEIRSFFRRTYDYV